MTYTGTHFKRKKPEPNPIPVGCLGTLYLGVLAALSYGILTVVTPRLPQIAPAAVRTLLVLPLETKVFGLTVPLTDGVILGAEILVLTVFFLGLTTPIYSIYYSGHREKEDWELYGEEAERLARQARAGKR